MPANEKLAVVTGGSRGIGKGVVLRLAQLGYSVVVNYQSNAEAARSTCEAAKSAGATEAIAFQADVADLNACRQLLDQTLAHFGRIDLLVNNAGVAPSQRLDLLETTPESWDRVLGINLKGPFFLTQCFANAMIRLGREGIVEDPQIIFVTSVSSTFASENRGEYCVSKSGLSMVAQLFASRLAREGIRVNEVRPGIIATDMTGGVKEVYDRRISEGLLPIARWGTPEDVGRAVGAIASGEFSYTCGEVFHVDGGLHLRRL